MTGFRSKLYTNSAFSPKGDKPKKINQKSAMKARGQKYLNPSHGDNKERIIENFPEPKIPKVSSSNHIIGASHH